MKAKKLIFLSIISVIIFVGCSHTQPPTHPKYPRYEIIKPPIRFKPSKKNLAKMIKKLQGSPYVWAEEGPHQFDCSGFTYYLYGSMGIQIPRVSWQQAKAGKRVPFDQLQYGDLLFFATDKRNKRRISHVGVYLGNGWFTHASTTQKKVVYTNLYHSPYYLKRLRICRRYLPEQSTRKIAHKNSKTTPFAHITSHTQHHLTNRTKHTIADQPPLTKGTYYIQVGSFEQTTTPHTIKRLQKLGYGHYLIYYQNAHKKMARLFAGPFASQKDANRHLKFIRKHIAQDAFIAQIT